jgi:hypothetical protein
MPTYKASDIATRPDFVEPGDYTVEVIHAEETVSQKGHDMIELKLRVEPSGAILFDHLVFMPNSFWKIDAFRVATGEEVTPDEDVEVIADDMIGRTGRVRLMVEEYKGRKRNKVAAWLTQPAAQTSTMGGVPHANRPF